MHKYFIIVLALCSSVLLGHAQGAVPTVHILPGDVVQNSIQRCNDNGGNIMVLWKYTEAGAKKMSFFWNTHAGQKVITRIGNFESVGTIMPQKPHPPGWVEDNGWLKTRTDKFCGIDEANAKMIIAGLKSQ